MDLVDKEPPTDPKDRKEVNLNVPASKGSDLQASLDSVFGPIHEEEEEEDEEDESEIHSPIPSIELSEPPIEELFDKKERNLLGFSPFISKNFGTKEVVSIENADFNWDEGSNDPTLNNITTKIPAGQLTIVVGAIGSGKSSLISAILGEIKLIKGDLRWAKCGKI